jgi:hypothetical protein
MPALRRLRCILSHNTPRILREATASTMPADAEASLKAFLKERTTAFKSR